MPSFKPDQIKEPTTEEIHKEFMKPFNEREIEDIFNSIQYNAIDNKDIGEFNFNQKISKDLSYQIEASIENIDNKKVLDKVLFSLYSSLEDKDIADLEFKKQKPPNESEYYYNMIHRYINSKALGISGTDFLNKAEDFLKILKKNGHLDAKKMGCGVSQVSVLEWLLKNNFNFHTSNQNKSEDFYTRNQVGEIVLQDKFILMKALDKDHDILKDSYIIDSDFITSPKFKKWQNHLTFHKASSNAPSEIIIELGRENDDEDNVISELTKDGYIPRFLLEKEI